MLSDSCLQDPVGIEDIDDARALAGDIVMLFGVLNCVGDINVAAKLLDTKGRIATWNMGILEATRQSYRVEIGIKHVYRAGPEIGGVNQTIPGRIRGNGQPF